MKVLMLTPYVPYPPSSGGQVRTFNLLKYLRKNHQITLIALYKNPEEKKFKEFLKPYCEKIYLCERPAKPWTLKNIIKAIFSFHPFLIIRNFSNELKELIDILLKKENFDIIHAETFYVMPHIPETKIPILLVEQTIEYKVYQHFLNSLPFFVRPFLYLDILKLIYWEKFYWRKASTVAAVSPIDEQMIKKLQKNIKTTIIPNGAGDEMFVEKLPKKDFLKPLLMFQGNFNWLQNQEAAKYLALRVFPEIKKDNPRVSLLISGQNVSKINYLKKEGITIFEIPLEKNEMVKDLYKKATVFVAPIFGPGGTRLKILAAMASGLPVVSTKVGVEGLDVKDNIHVLLARDEKDFSKKINYLLSNHNLYEKIRKNAFFLVKKKFNWKKITKKLETVYLTIKKQ